MLNDSVCACAKQHFMRELASHEHHQGACIRGDIEALTVGQIQAQGAAVIGLPVRIEIEHGGHAAAVIVAKTVEMRLVERARRIESEVTLELLQAEVQLAVELLAQRIHQLQVEIAGGRLAGFQPENAVAAYAFMHRLASAASDRGWHHDTLRLAAATLFGEAEGVMAWDERTLYRPATHGQVIDESRKLQDQGSERSGSSNRHGGPRGATGNDARS